MRILFLLLLFALTGSCAQKQPNYKGFDLAAHSPQINSLSGRWSISELISSPETKEYVLKNQSPDKSDNYGNNISLNADQTFVSGYSAECGNDCFTVTKGRYKIIDENYICFYLEAVERSGDCSGNSKPNEDLGLYYYYKEENGFRLLKSEGVLEQDQKNRQYLDLIVAKRKEINEFYYRDGQNQIIYNWKQTHLKDEKEIVAFCMAENKIEDYEILSSYNGGLYSRLRVIMVKANNEFRYVLYDTWGNPMVALYDDSATKNIDQMVKAIDNDPSLNKTVKKITSGNTSSSSTTAAVFKNGNEICKVRYEIKYHYEKKAVFIATLYFRNSTPIFIDYLSSPDQDKQISQTALYVLDWEKNQGASRIIKHESGQMNKVLGSEKPIINKIMEEIKTAN